MRGGVILSLADSEPGLARACLVETQSAGDLVNAERERILARLTRVLDEGAHRDLSDGVDPLAGMPVRLTYRTAKVLQAVAALDGSERGPSNREVADLAEVHDHGQISKLLARLEHYGLVEGALVGRGEPNSWELTEQGRRLVRSIGAAGAGAQRSAA